MSERPTMEMRAASLFDLSGRVALITGGGTGIGAGIAETLAANGARVVLVGNEDAPLAEKAAALGHERALPVTADVTDDDGIERAFDRAEAAFGAVSILVNAAGIGQRGSARDIDRAAWRAVTSVNVESAFVVSRIAAGRMIGAGIGGSIINVGSFLREKPMRNVAAYAATKAAMQQMTRSLALEWARHGIRVNELVPGWIATAMTEPFLGGRAGEIIAQSNPMRRLGEPADLAGAALLLASDAGRYMTGGSIVVDGGQTLA